MIDPVLLVSALLLLPLILLFHFIGCHWVFQLDPVAHQLFIKVRVPATLTVTEIRYQVTRPNGTGGTSIVPNPTPGTEDGENTFSHAEDLIDGPWEVRCRLQVTDSNGVADTDQGIGTFMLTATGEASLTATFQASGTPTDANFRVRYVGLS